MFKNFYNKLLGGGVMQGASLPHNAAENFIIDPMAI